MTGIIKFPMIIYMKKKNPKDELVTKGYLDKRLGDFSSGIVKYIDMRFEQMEERLDQKISIKLDKIANALDTLLGTINRIDQTVIILDASYPRINDKLDSHETRIKKLEKKNLN